MPKYVDHDLRRQELLEALWRVVERDGAGSLSIRTIAAEARVSKTNVAYYFPHRLAILMAAAEQVVVQVNGAAKAEFLAQPCLETAIDALSIAVPTTPTRRRQAEVWLMLMLEGIQSTEVAGVLDAFNGSLLKDYRDGLELLVANGVLDASLDLDLEARRIQALIDGLSLHILTNEQRLDASLVRDIVGAHLRTLAPTQGSVL